MAEIFNTETNLRIYNYGRAVPDTAKKSIQAGRLKGMTDINPMFRIKTLTEMFGPCGIGWWPVITREEIVDDPITNQRVAFLDLLLYYVDPETGTTSQGVFGTGGASLTSQERNGPYLSDEAFKMAFTDALSVACRSLGIAGDVYWEKDRSKYDATPGTPASSSPAPTPPRSNAGKSAETVTAVVDLPENPNEVSQDLLNSIIRHLRAKNKKDVSWENEHLIPLLKAENNGNVQFTNIPDPAIRLSIYTKLYTNYIKGENAA